MGIDSNKTTAEQLEIATRILQAKYKEFNAATVLNHPSYPGYVKLSAAEQTARIRANSKQRQQTKEYKDWQDAKYRLKLEIKAGRPRPVVCDCCHERPNRNSLAFDHDHETGLFRGWLCTPCNKALGLLKDNTRKLRNLADYIDAHRAVHGQ